jgi:hypothetical protein
MSTMFFRLKAVTVISVCHQAKPWSENQRPCASCRVTR